MDYPISRYSIIPLIKRLFVDEIYGIENLKKVSPPFIIASNHISQIDPLMILPPVFKIHKKKIHFITIQGRYGKILNHIVAKKWAGCILLDIKKTKKSKIKVIEESDKLIKNKKIIGIFPEGERIPDGDFLLMGKTGIIRLAIKNKVPIIPIGIHTKGEKHVKINGIKRSRIRDVIVHHFKNRKKTKNKLIIGEPIYIHNFWENNSEICYTQLRLLTSRLMKQISLLSGKKYTFHTPDYFLPNKTK